MHRSYDLQLNKALAQLGFPSFRLKQKLGYGLLEEPGCPRHPVKMEITGSNPVWTALQSCGGNGNIRGC